MKKFFLGWPGLALLAACHAAPEHPAAAPAAASPSAAVASAPAPPAAPAPPYTGYHRYRGTVGGQPVTVELTIDSTEASPRKKLTCTGSYYYGQAQGGVLDLAAEGTYQPQQLLRLQETDGGKVSGTWQATQPAGPLLAGTWSSPGGKQLPFKLHEDYTDGQGHPVTVWYELLQEGDEAPCQPIREEGESKAAYRARAEDQTGSCTHFFLHLLGPDTLLPVLRALQCPVPAKRRRLMHQEIAGAGCIRLEYDLDVLYDEHSLLSLGSFDIEDYTGAGAVHPSANAGAVTYDLRTGRPLTIVAIIRPGTDTTLSRLIAQHLEQDENITAEEALKPSGDDSMLAPFPQQGLGIVDEGLKFQYGLYEVQPPGPPVAVVVPWRELLPLLRPDSPVARMLRERGLWPTNGKKSR